jgi:hypothetical protein
MKNVDFKHKSQTQLRTCDTNCNQCYPTFLFIFCPALQNKFWSYNLKEETFGRPRCRRVDNIKMHLE